VARRADALPFEGLRLDRVMSRRYRRSTAVCEVRCPSEFYYAEGL